MGEFPGMLGLSSRRRDGTTTVVVAAGLRVLEALARSATECGVELSLGEVSPAVYRLLRLTGQHERYPSAVPSPPPKLAEPR